VTKSEARMGRARYRGSDTPSSGLSPLGNGLSMSVPWLNATDISGSLPAPPLHIPPLLAGLSGCAPALALRVVSHGLIHR
jgi:hypothetical protein